MDQITRDPWRGQILRDRYVVERVLAEGGMARVYVAHDWRTGQRFAIKIPFGELAADAMSRARLVREVASAARLRHANVVSIVDVGETEQQLIYLVMEFVDGESMHDVVQRGPTEPRQALRWVRQIAEGLGHAHRHGILHRDLKPGNVLISRANMRARIADFGLSSGLQIEEDSRMTTEGRAAGTLSWMSPEQAMALAVDERSDLFNLGLILFELLAGRGPFDGTYVERHFRIARDPLPAVDERAPEVQITAELQRLIDSLTKKAPADRPQDAAAAVEAIDAVERSARARRMNSSSSPPPLPEVC